MLPYMLSSVPLKYNPGGDGMNNDRPSSENTAKHERTDISDDDKTALYRLLYNSSRDIILFLGYPEGNIIEANNAAVQAYGYDRDEMLSLTIFDLRAPETHSTVITQMEEADLSGIMFETLHRRRNRTVFPVEVSFTAASAGKERLVLSIVRDISARKCAEEALDQAREEFISTLMHDLKGPLGSIIASLKLISDPRFGEISEKKHEFVDMTKYSCDILHTIVNNLINVSMIESGRMNFVFADFNMFLLMEELSRGFAPMAIVNSISMIFNCPENLLISADRQKIRDVFFNLISNAFRYTSSGGTISVTASSSGEYADICIADTGIGISKNEQQRIFEKYGQLRGERRGSGLGLYIVKKVLEGHGSSITVQSEEKSGTSFRFRLRKGKACDVQLEAKKACKQN
jgi:PAS domain S-box-containing protein